MKEASNIYRIKGLIELIERTEKLIDINSHSTFMSEQYEYKKKMHLKELLDELTKSEPHPEHSFGVMLLSLKRIYPELIKLAKKEKVKKAKQKELKTLEEVFAGVHKQFISRLSLILCNYEIAHIPVFRPPTPSPHRYHQ